jgi:hypothetical protein
MELYGNKNFIVVKSELIKYIQVIKDFINNVISVQEFESNYLRMVKDETFVFKHNIAKVIETLFSDVDAYCGDPEIANYDTDDPFADIDENELRKRAKDSLQQLLELFN